MIRTARLLLRRARADDLDDLHAAMRDPEVMRYWSTPPHATLAETQAFLAAEMDADPAQSDDYFIERDGRVIGKMGSWRLPDIGFLLARDQWGQGVASEAMVAFLAHRRQIAPGSRLTADVDPRNRASQALLARHGFVETHRAERTWHVGDEWCDSVYFALDL